MTIMDTEYSEETREASPTNLLIKIESFSLLSERGIESYESRTFNAGGYKWKLILKFEGDEKGDFSVYFSIADSESLSQVWEFNAIFTFFIYNHLQDNYSCFRGVTQRFSAVCPKWGFSKLMGKKYLIDPREGYIVDNSCVFGAEVFVIKRRQRVSECLSLNEDTARFKRDWKISDLSKLNDGRWNSEEFKAGDDHKWKATLYAKDSYISIYLNCESATEFFPHYKVKAEICMRIKSKFNGTHKSETFDHWFTLSSPNTGYAEFISIDDMKKRGFLVDDCCIFEVEIFVQAIAHEAPQL